METLTPPTLTEARALIASLAVGQSVILTRDGHDSAVTVQRREGLDVHRHPDGRTVTVGYGLGRWNTEVNADGLAAGYYALTVPEPEPVTAAPAPLLPAFTPYKIAVTWHNGNDRESVEYSGPFVWDAIFAACRGIFARYEAVPTGDILEEMRAALLHSGRYDGWSWFHVEMVSA